VVNAKLMLTPSSAAEDAAVPAADPAAVVATADMVDMVDMATVAAMVVSDVDAQLTTVELFQDATEFFKLMLSIKMSTTCIIITTMSNATACTLKSIACVVATLARTAAERTNLLVEASQRLTRELDLSINN